MSKREREERGEDGKKKKKVERVLESDVVRAFEEKDTSRAREMLREEIDRRTGYTDIGLDLQLAALAGFADCVKVMIQNGADVNAVDYDGLTALLRAAWHGLVDVAKVLIKSGADVNAVTEFRKETALHMAAEYGHIDVVKVLIQNGADVNAVNESNWTALHYASRDGHATVAKVLIQNGADVNAVTTMKSTALHYAAQYNRFDIAKVLLQNGADVNAVDRNESTALHFATHEETVTVNLYIRSPDIALLLLCFGGKIREKDIKRDNVRILRPINDRLESLRAGNGMETTLISDEEKRFMWNLAFFFTLKHRVAAFKAYYAIRSFITYNGIFMGPGYDLGDESIWRIVRTRTVEESGDEDW